MLPQSVAGIPGVWSHLMTFIGGPRACIGYCFALIECVSTPRLIPVVANVILSRMKALLFTLIRAFEFELAVPADDIIKRSLIVQRPLVRYEQEKGSQMPLLVKAYQSAS